jgi:hypothetical protein
MTAPVCADELQKLYTVITALASGKQTVSIGFGERQVSYTAGSLPALSKIWGMWYRVCGAESGLPDIGSPVERGGPARSRIND